VGLLQAIFIQPITRLDFASKGCLMQLQARLHLA
jgi:hypothetical protein